MANFNLLRSNILYMEKAVSEIKGEKNPGDSVTTTLNYDLQLQAYDALGSYDAVSYTHLDVYKRQRRNHCQ